MMIVHTEICLALYKGSAAQTIVKRAKESKS